MRYARASESSLRYRSVLLTRISCNELIIFFSPGLTPWFSGLFTDATELIRFLLILFLFFLLFMSHGKGKLVAALLRVARVTTGLAESNGSLPPGLWLTLPAG